MQKSDFDRQLHALYRLENDLWQAKKALPLLPLNEPYQKGWKRSFILRADVKRSNSVGFLEVLLSKINTIQYSSDKTFTTKSRSKGRKTYPERVQHLKSFALTEWADPKVKLTDEERVHFQLQECCSEDGNTWQLHYVFSEPWRYRLQIKPHIITHVKMLDHVLEQQIKEVDNRIKRRHLRPRINKLLGGAYTYRKQDSEEQAKYRSNFKNIPLHALNSECTALPTT